MVRARKKNKQATANVNVNDGNGNGNGNATQVQKGTQKGTRATAPTAVEVRVTVTGGTVTSVSKAEPPTSILKIKKSTEENNTHFQMQLQEWIENDADDVEGEDWEPPYNWEGPHKFDEDSLQEKNQVTFNKFGHLFLFRKDTHARSKTAKLQFQEHANFRYYLKDESGFVEQEWRENVNFREKPRRKDDNAKDKPKAVGKYTERYLIQKRNDDWAKYERDHSWEGDKQKLKAYRDPTLSKAKADALETAKKKLVKKHVINKLDISLQGKARSPELVMLLLPGGLCGLQPYLVPTYWNKKLYQVGELFKAIYFKDIQEDPHGGNPTFDTGERNVTIDYLALVLRPRVVKMIIQCIEEGFEGIFRVDSPTYHENFQHDQFVTHIRPRACGGLECRIDNHIHVYDDGKTALDSFTNKGEPFNDYYLQKMESNRMDKDKSWFSLPVGAKEEGAKALDYLEDTPIIYRADANRLDCIQAAVLETVRILGGDLAGKLDALTTALEPIKVKGNTNYLRDYDNTINNTLGLKCRKQNTFSSSEPFQAADTVFLVGSINRHAYGIIKQKDRYMIIDAAEPFALAMVDGNLDKMANGKFIKFKRLMVFTKREETTATTKTKTKSKRRKSKSRADDGMKKFNGRTVENSSDNGMIGGMSVYPRKKTLNN